MNLCEWLCPRFNFPESNAPRGWVDVAVCGALSLFTHLTVVPGATVTWGGLKAKFLMFTVTFLPCVPAVGAEVTFLPCAPVVGAKSSRATSESAANDGSSLLIQVPPHLWRLHFPPRRRRPLRPLSSRPRFVTLSRYVRKALLGLRRPLKPDGHAYHLRVPFSFASPLSPSGAQSMLGAGIFLASPPRRRSGGSSGRQTSYCLRSE